MRFSLKWILAGMVYVAIAAVAFTRSTTGFSEALWAIALFAIVYAATLSVFTRGRRRAAAIAFVLGSVCYIASLAVGDAFNKPSKLMLEMADYTPAAVLEDAQTGEMLRIESMARSGSDDVSYVTGLQVFSRRVRAANAVATLAFGLMGSLVGLLAFRASGHETDRRN